jgi:anti-sigma B factor antagonist
MTLEQRAVGSVIILDLSGRLAISEGDERLQDKVRSLVFEGHRQFVFNLHRLSYIDSTGLASMIASYHVVTKAGGKLVLVGLTDRVSNVLAITKLLTVFDVHESEVEAIVSFSGQHKNAAN